MIDCSPCPNQRWSAISGSNGSHRFSTLPALISLTSLLVRPYPTRSTNAAGAAIHSKANSKEERRSFLGRSTHEQNDVGNRKCEICTTRKCQEQCDARNHQHRSKGFSRSATLGTVPDTKTQAVRDRQESAELIGMKSKIREMLASLGRHHRQGVSRCGYLADDQQTGQRYQRPDWSAAMAVSFCLSQSAAPMKIATNGRSTPGKTMVL